MMHDQSRVYTVLDNLSVKMLYTTTKGEFRDCDLVRVYADDDTFQGSLYRREFAELLKYMRQCGLTITRTTYRVREWK